MNRWLVDTSHQFVFFQVVKYKAASPKKQKQIFNQLVKDVRLACDNRANMAEVSKILREKLDADGSSWC